MLFSGSAILFRYLSTLGASDFFMRGTAFSLRLRRALILAYANPNMKKQIWQRKDWRFLDPVLHSLLFERIPQVMRLCLFKRFCSMKTLKNMLSTSALIRPPLLTRQYPFISPGGGGTWRHLGVRCVSSRNPVQRSWSAPETGVYRMISDVNLTSNLLRVSYHWSSLLLYNTLHVNSAKTTRVTKKRHQ